MEEQMLGLNETRVDPELEPFLISPHCTYRTDQPPYEGDTVTGACNSHTKSRYVYARHGH